MSLSGDNVLLRMVQWRVLVSKGRVSSVRIRKLGIYYPVIYKYIL
jgi:hypothetical protein